MNVSDFNPINMILNHSTLSADKFLIKLWVTDEDSIENDKADNFSLIFLNFCKTENTTA